MAYTVFVSSTRQDLIPYRDAVSRHLRKAGYVPSEMEVFGARDQEPLEASLQAVVDADLFVGVYAWRYGFVPQGSAVSITEQELLEADRRRKPIFSFIIDEDQEWPAAFREGGEGSLKLEALKRRLRERWVVESFTTPEGLAAGVLAALTQWQERQLPARLPPERHVQLALLDKVERLWVEDFLRRFVPEERRLRIGREQRPEAVGRPSREGAAPGGENEEVVEPIHDLFLRQGRSLLILGSPGSGKTIALLDLARGLARVARRDPAAPVPVVFHLASWRGDDRDLAAWMVRELANHYKAGPKAAAEWIGRDQILPLLDGLDEVEPDCRPGCVEALNAHLRDHGLATGMAVACHAHVYEDLPVRLQLETAVALRPLAPGRIDEHLAAAGPPSAGLRAALAAEAGLRELAASPLMLFLLERTFRDAAPEDLPSGRSAGLVHQVFDAYVTRVLEPGRELPWAAEESPPGWLDRLGPRRARAGRPAPAPSAGRYPPERTRRTLAWLARGMAEHDPALFQIERLQPAWFATRGQVLAYALLSRALSGGLLTLPLAIPLAASFPFLAVAGLGLLAGALVGLVEGPRLRTRRPAGPDRWMGRTLLLAVGVFAFFLAAGSLWLARTLGETTAGWRLLTMLPTSLLCSLLFGLIFGGRGAGRDGSRDIRIAEALVWRSWSWPGTAFGAASLLLLTLATWGVYAVLPSASLPYADAGFFLPLSGITALLGALLGGALGGLGERALEKKAWPNQGTWLTLRNAGVVGLATALATGFVLALFLAALLVLRHLAEEPPGNPVQDSKALLLLALTLGFWAGLAYSGLDFVQHFSLRAVLRLWQLVPARLVGFLDHTVERGLLQRPGGSYKFFHPLLLDHFARRGEADRPPSS